MASIAHTLKKAIFFAGKSLGESLNSVLGDTNTSTDRSASSPNRRRVTGVFATSVDKTQELIL